MTIQFVANEQGRKTAALVPIEIRERLTSGPKPCRSWQDVQDGCCDGIEFRDDVIQTFKDTDSGTGLTCCIDEDDMFRRLMED